jgi:hypothetical protein
MPVASLLRWPALWRITSLALAAIMLSGCVVVPAYPWHPYPRGYYYR